MDINTIQIQTPLDSTRLSGTSGFAMPARGCTFGTAMTAARTVSTITNPGTSTDCSVERVIRDRKAVATKGHMGLVAYVPGLHAWSPPLC